MKAQAGFTLIEVLTGGVISTVLAGATLSLFYMVTGNIKESAANSRLLRIQTVAEDQIRRTARRAYGAKRPTELAAINTLADPSSGDANAYTGLKEIDLYQDPDAPIGAYKISDDTLLELVNGKFTPMHIGTDTVRLDGARSFFSIFPYRRGVAFDLRYKILENGSIYADSSLTDSVLCRGKI